MNIYQKTVGIVLFLCVLLVENQSFAAKSQQAIERPTVVNVAKVTTTDIPKNVSALGSLTAIQKVVISSEDNGRVSKINFSDGAEVNQGMPIIQLDDVEAEANYKSAVTNYKLAQQKYERSKQLLNEAISKQELDALKADVDNKQSLVQTAQAALSKKQISAPFTGILGAFKVQEGDYVKAGDPLVNLVNLSELRADYNLAENLLPQLKKGQLVKVTVNTYPDKAFFGSVNFISPTIDQSTRSIAVQAVIPNKEHVLSPGMFVHLSQQVGTFKNALVVPSQAISADVKGYFVYRIIDNKAVQTYVNTGERQNDQVQVLSGLKLDDVIVVAGQQKLSDGSLVSISDSPTG